MRSDISGTTITHFSVSETDNLQAAVDEISAQIIDTDITGKLGTFNRNRYRGGAEIHLQRGTYDCDLTIYNPNVTIRGDGSLNTEINGKVTVYAPFVQMYDLAIRAPGKPYGLRVMRNPAALNPFGKPYQNISRCRFENLIIGGSYWAPANPFDAGAPGVPIDGPVNGVEIDGVYLTDFKHVTSAFCQNDGWHIESSNALYPSTTLGFTDCSAVKNGRYGYWVKGSLNGFHVLRGNVEQNGNYTIRGAASNEWSLTADGLYEAAEMRLESVTNIHLQSVDFEGNIPFDNIIMMAASNTGIIEGCSFFYDATWNAPKPNPLRFFGGATCTAIKVRGNRTQGFGAGRIGQFDDRCNGCSVEDHGYADSFGGSAVNQHIKVLNTGHPFWNSYR